MIDRYTRPEMAEVWSEQRRYSHWLEIELLAVEARARAGDVPESEANELRAKAGFDLGRIAELERKTRHDVAAFVDNVAEIAGPSARHLHYGMTSSDILDTALALQMREGLDLISQSLDRLIDIVVKKAREHAETLMAFRTHGMHAEPGTLGVKIAGWAFELDRNRQRLQSAKKEISVGKLSGAVGTYSQLSPEVEADVMSHLGLQADEASTQVVSRDRHAVVLARLAILAATIERIAVEIRHLARTEIGEVEEPFASGEQKGSSAMPHKRNPWRWERMTGLARMVRGGVGPVLENMVLWHERDISHSSVERVLVPDTYILVDFMLSEAIELLDGMVVNADRMQENIDRSFGLLFSQSALLALIDTGLTRDEAYRIVQEASAEAMSSRTHLREVLAGHAAVKERGVDIDRCFDEKRYLEHAQQIVDRLSRLER